MTRGPRGDDGQLLVLMAFLGAVLALLVAVVTDASAVFLARRSLASEADAAATKAAQRLDLGAYYATGAIAVTGGDGDTVTVTLRREVRLPLAPPGYRRVTVSATATARLRDRG